MSQFLITGRSGPIASLVIETKVEPRGITLSIPGENTPTYELRRRANMLDADLARETLRRDREKAGPNWGRGEKALLFPFETSTIVAGDYVLYLMRYEVMPPHSPSLILEGTKTPGNHAITIEIHEGKGKKVAQLSLIGELNVDGTFQYAVEIEDSSGLISQQS